MTDWFHSHTQLTPPHSTPKFFSVQFVEGSVSTPVLSHQMSSPTPFPCVLVGFGPRGTDPHQFGTGIDSWKVAPVHPTTTAGGTVCVCWIRPGGERSIQIWGRGRQSAGHIRPILRHCKGTHRGGTRTHPRLDPPTDLPRPVSGSLVWMRPGGDRPTQILDRGRLSAGHSRPILPRDSEHTGAGRVRTPVSFFFYVFPG